MDLVRQAKAALDATLKRKDTAATRLMHDLLVFERISDDRTEDRCAPGSRP
jgi:hypothetical protein